MRICVLTSRYGMLPTPPPLPSPPPGAVAGGGRSRPAPAPPAGKDAAAAQIPPRRGAPRRAPEVARVVQETARVPQGSWVCSPPPPSKKKGRGGRRRWVMERKVMGREMKDREVVDGEMKERR